MKLFGLDIKRATPPMNSAGPGSGTVFAGGKKNFGTAFQGGGMMIDGVSISQAYNTYWRMYKNNTDIFRCIEEKVQTAMKKGYEFQKVNVTDGKRKTVTDPEFVKALGNIDDMKKLIIMALDIFADVFIRKRKNIRGNTIGFEVLDTREVAVITDPDLKPIRYTYRRKTPTSLTVDSFPAEDVVHFRSGHNWDNPLFGYTVLSTLIYDALSDDEASKVNYYWYANDAMPSSLYILKESLSTEEKELAIENIQDTLKGSHNAGKSMITDTVTDVKQIARSETGLDDIAKRKYATEKICAGLGVPRSILGYIEDVNYSNGDVQLKKFIENTIQPLERMLEQIFTELGKDFGGFEFVINSEHIDQLQQLSVIARDNVAQGLWTRNEAREYLGWDTINDNDMMNEITVPSTSMLIDDLLLGEPEIPVPDTVTKV